jgi:hypothetical protein
MGVSGRFSEEGKKFQRADFILPFVRRESLPFSNQIKSERQTRNLVEYETERIEEFRTSRSLRTFPSVLEAFLSASDRARHRRRARQTSWWGQGPEVGACALPPLLLAPCGPVGMFVCFAFWTLDGLSPSIGKYPTMGRTYHKFMIKLSPKEQCAPGDSFSLFLAPS